MFMFALVLKTMFSDILSSQVGIVGKQPGFFWDHTCPCVCQRGPRSSFACSKHCYPDIVVCPGVVPFQKRMGHSLPISRRELLQTENTS